MTTSTSEQVSENFIQERSIIVLLDNYLKMNELRNATFKASHTHGDYSRKILAYVAEAFDSRGAASGPSMLDPTRER